MSLPDGPKSPDAWQMLQWVTRPFSFMRDCRHRYGDRFTVTLSHRVGPIVFFSDPEALQVILKLTQIGDLTRLRHCAQCQKWLYARFRHQVFCSTACQQKNYTKCEQFKAHRRRYMRDRYQKLVKNPFGRRKRVVSQKTRGR